MTQDTPEAPRGAQRPDLPESIAIYDRTPPAYRENEAGITFPGLIEHADAQALARFAAYARHAKMEHFATQLLLAADAAAWMSDQAVASISGVEGSAAWHREQERQIRRRISADHEDWMAKLNRGLPADQQIEPIGDDGFVVPDPRQWNPVQPLAEAADDGWRIHMPDGTYYRRMMTHWERHTPDAPFWDRIDDSQVPGTVADSWRAIPNPGWLLPPEDVVKWSFDNGVDQGSSYAIPKEDGTLEIVNEERFKAWEEQTEQHDRFQRIVSTPMPSKADIKKTLEELALFGRGLSAIDCDPVALRMDEAATMIDRLAVQVTLYENAIEEVKRYERDTINEIEVWKRSPKAVDHTEMQQIATNEIVWLRSHKADGTGVSVACADLDDVANNMEAMQEEIWRLDRQLSESTNREAQLTTAIDKLKDDLAEKAETIDWMDGKHTTDVLIAEARNAIQRHADCGDVPYNDAISLISKLRWALIQSKSEIEMLKGAILDKDAALIDKDAAIDAWRQAMDLKYNIGEIMQANVFEANGITNLHDMQLVLDKTEAYMADLWARIERLRAGRDGVLTWRKDDLKAAALVVDKAFRQLGLSASHRKAEGVAADVLRSFGAKPEGEE